MEGVSGPFSVFATKQSQGVMWMTLGFLSCAGNQRELDEEETEVSNVHKNPVTSHRSHVLRVFSTKFSSDLLDNRSKCLRARDRTRRDQMGPEDLGGTSEKRMIG